MPVSVTQLWKWIAMTSAMFHYAAPFRLWSGKLCFRDMELTQPVTEGLNAAQTSAPDPFFSVLYKIISTYEECMKDYIFLFLLKICCAKNAPVGSKLKGIIE